MLWGDLILHHRPGKICSERLPSKWGGLCSVLHRTHEHLISCKLRIWNSCWTKNLQCRTGWCRSLKGGGIGQALRDLIILIINNCSWYWSCSVPSHSKWGLPTLPAGSLWGLLHKYIYWANWDENLCLPWVLWELPAQPGAGSWLTNANWVQNILIYLETLMIYP